MRDEVSGVVEVDESYFGARRIRGKRGKLKRGRGTKKIPVFGIFERRTNSVYTEIVSNCKKPTLQKIIEQRVSAGSVVYSDGWRGYSGLSDLGYHHDVIRHGNDEFARGAVHVNSIESFWSFAKRRLAKFNGVGVSFERHLIECEWRWGRDSHDLEQNIIKITKKYAHLLV